ncbi:unnamed protein product [Menidia menidia]|uniref:(Atlantic silverside) hypothetical protein n=1 Tax=Menidia menidia TaxID=238744 RepID=A0A8S4B9H5_9TELE|nr:unnamed protein product [Menidia menidia]
MVVVVMMRSLPLQISDIQVNGQSDDMTAKEKLLLWAQRMVEGYQGLRCDNFTTSWRDGRLFSAIIHKHRVQAKDPAPLLGGNVLRSLPVRQLEAGWSSGRRRSELGRARLGWHRSAFRVGVFQHSPGASL